MLLWIVSALFSTESICIAIVILCLIRYYIHRKWQRLQKLGIPHEPPSLWNVGNMRGVFSTDTVCQKMLELKRKYGLVYGCYFGLEPCIVIHDTDMLRQIYTKEFHNFPDRQKLLTRLHGKDMNHGLIVIRGNKWKRIRLALSPTFAIMKLKQTFTIIDHCLARTLKILDQKSSSGLPFDAKRVFSNLALDVIVSSALGTTVDTQSSGGRDTRLMTELKNLFTRGFAGPVGMICTMFPSLEWIFENLEYGFYPKKSLDYVHKFTNAVIEDRLKNEKSRRLDLLQFMLDAEVSEDEISDEIKKGITRDELIGNAMLMIGAGFDNSANVMTCMAHCLAFHPNIQVKLQQEIDDTFRDKGCFDYDSVKGMKYLEMCVNETMRLYPVFIRNGRVCRKDTVVNGLYIPKNMVVKIPVYFLAHDPDYWEDPWEYKPERMEDMSQIDPMRFQPFGFGPRGCIGMKFAEMEIKMAMCLTLREFSFSPCEDTPRPPLKTIFKMALVPKEEFRLKVTRR